MPARDNSGMSVVLKPFPVLYACQGCTEFGQVARDVGALLDRRGLAEMVWLGRPDLKPNARFPIFALDGCAKACARRWLVQLGVTPQRHFVLTELGVAKREGRDFDAAQAEDIAQRLAADLRSPAG